MPAFREMGYPSDKEIQVEAEIPGMNPEDITISIKDDALVSQGAKRFADEEKKESSQRFECSYGSFSR